MHCITEHLLNILIQRHRCSHKSIMMYALYAVKMLICGDCECLPRCADVGSDTARRHYYGSRSLRALTLSFGPRMRKMPKRFSIWMSRRVMIQPKRILEIAR